MDVRKLLTGCEKDVFKQSNRKPYHVSVEWAKQTEPVAGVYAFFEKGKAVYIGESGALSGIMRSIRLTTKSTFRREIGGDLFSHIMGYEKATSSKAFAEHIEEMINDHMETLEVAIVPVPFGRTEIKEYLIGKYKPRYNMKTRTSDGLGKSTPQAGSVGVGESQKGKVMSGKEELSFETLVSRHIPGRMAMSIIKYFIEGGRNVAEVKEIASAIGEKEKVVAKMMAELEGRCVLKKMATGVYNYAPTSELDKRIKDFMSEIRGRDMRVKLTGLLLAAER